MCGSGKHNSRDEVIIMFGRRSRAENFEVSCLFMFDSKVVAYVESCDFIGRSNDANMYIQSLISNAVSTFYSYYFRFFHLLILDFENYKNNQNNDA